MEFVINSDQIFAETKEWENATNKFQGQGPSPRSGHGAVYIKNKVYIFGGSNYFQSRLHYNDMYILDLGNTTILLVSSIVH